MQEKVDRYLSTPFLRKKAPLDVGLIPKTTAGQERKKLWLIDRTCKAKMKTRFFENNTTSDHAGLQETSQYSELQRPLSALERREIMLQEKAEQVRLKESRKLLVSEMMQKQKEAEIRKKIHHRNFKRIEKENAVKKLQWARESAAERLVNKLNTDDSRIAAFKEVQEQQRRAIAAIQRRVFRSSHSPFTLSCILLHPHPITPSLMNPPTQGRDGVFRKSIKISLDHGRLKRRQGC